MPGNSNSGAHAGELQIVRGTPESGAAAEALLAIPMEDRRVAVDDWARAHPTAVAEVLTSMHSIATQGDDLRSAVAAGKVFLDHVAGKAPEAREALPTQILQIIRGAKLEREAVEEPE